MIVLLRPLIQLWLPNKGYNMKKTTFTLFLLLFTQVALADFTSALESYQRGNLSAAAAEFKTLANRNDADAQYMLGYMYALGEGVTQDYVNAHKWLNIAASQGKDGARKTRDQVAKRMSSRQITRAQQLARNWKPVQTRTPPSLISNQPHTTVYISSRNTIMEVQRRLSKLGYRPGPADGSPGSRTRNAIRHYQTDNRLLVNGQVTRQLVKHLLPQHSAGAVSWGYPQVWATPSTKPNRATRELVRDLERLIGKIKAQQAADRWVIRDLRKLVRKNQHTWPRTLLHERFSRRNFRLGQNWDVTSGRFQTDPGTGLQSDATTLQSSRGDSREELAVAILNSFLGGDNRQFRKNRVAQITTHKKISNAFATRARFSAIDRDSRIALMLSRGGKRDTGYRLVLDTDGKRDKVSLVHVSRSGSAVIEKFRGRLGLSNGSSHTIEWTRDQSGRMAVAIDGRELFRAVDTNLRKRFTQFSITNVGGNYVLWEMMLLDAG